MKVSAKDLMPIIEEKLASGGSVSLTVTGSSMRPFFRNQDTVVTLEKPKEPINVFDVILYKNQTNQIVLHRVIKITKEIYVVYGDALKSVEHVKPSQILAVVTNHTVHNKMISSKSKKYRLKVRLWVALKPIRRYLLFLDRNLRR